MLFNSIDFAIFLPIVFLLYWFVVNKNLKLQNLLIVIASYIFYGWWDWRFLSLLIFSSLLDYGLGRLLGKTLDLKKRKLILLSSIIINLGILGLFKYFDFFINNFATAFSFFGYPIHLSTLHIILPIGISFYTFQSLSYVIDVYRKKLEPTKDLISFLAFVSFFPQLVAGPIERATNLLPQFQKKRSFDHDKAVDGCRQILWGLFKKMVIADNCAIFANMIFNNSSAYSGSTLVFGAIFFAFQIYGDFSGYSDIAIGTARLFNINLRKNFAFPYFSRDIAEFWRRWHISLSSWFKDYVYIPLGGSRGSKWLTVRNTFIIFILCGFWHGANWTFLAWGALNAIYFLPLLLANKNRQNLDTVAANRRLPTVRELFSMFTTFILTTFALIFFRSPNLDQAWGYISGIFSTTIFELPNFAGQSITIYLLIMLFIVIEWIGRRNEYALEKMQTTLSRPLRWSFYFFICILIILFTVQKQQPFIYFQF